MNSLSIIVPVFNVEKYLSRCIDSILSQIYNDFELILVNDGSTDNSGKICDEYASKDSRIIVIHKENGGVSSARNIGIQISTGKFVSFIDADDSISPHFYSSMLNHNLDIDLIICGYIEIESDGTKKNYLYNIPSNKRFNSSEIIQIILNSTFTNSNLTNSCCNKIYNSKTIKSNNLQFNNRRRGEDWLFNITYLQLINSAIYYNYPNYNYYRNKTSRMSKPLIEQFSLWIENRNIRQNLIHKYNLKINQITYDSIWINKVIAYLFDLFDSDTPCYRSIIFDIFKNNEFIAALNNGVIKSKLHKPIRFLLLNNLNKLCYTYIALLYILKKIKYYD